MPRYESARYAIHPLRKLINASGRIKETLRKEFAELANTFARRVHDISSELTAMSGPLEVNVTLPTVDVSNVII